MNDCYCKNCNNIVGKWNIELEHYELLNYCNFIESKNIDIIYFLDCIYCNKFIGILCSFVCKTCFGKNEIIGEKNLYNFFLKYKKLQLKYINYEFICKICDTKDFKWQFWFFKELTFYK